MLLFVSKITGSEVNKKSRRTWHR